MMAFSFIFFASCTEESDDIARPSTTLNPLANTDYALGTDIEMTAYFTDDLDLDNYRFTIKPASDDWPVPGFSTVIEGNIGGLSQTITETVTIPETNEDGSAIGAGPHTLSVFCTDRVTQYSDTLEVTFNIYNPADQVGPVINVTAPPDLSVPTSADTNSDNDIYVTGDISDESGLAQVTYSYVFRDEASTEYNDQNFPFNGTLTEEAPTSYLIEGNSETSTSYFKAPGTIGNYNLVITAYDVYNNSSSVTIPVNVNK